MAPTRWEARSNKRYGRRTVEGILRDPSTQFRIWDSTKYGPMIDFLGPAGRGVRYYGDGRFFGFFNW